MLKSDTKKIENVQERALCFIYRTFESDYKSLLNLAGRYSLHMDRLRTIVTEVYKAINGMSPECLQHLFVLKANVHDLRHNNKMKLYKFKTITYGKQSIQYVAGKANVHDLRDNNKMKLYKFKTITYGKQSIKYVAGIPWNSINVDIKKYRKCKCFKRKIRNWQGPFCQCGECLICISKVS